MFAPILLSLAMISGAPAPIIVVDEQPRIQITLADYDLARPEDVKKLKRKIRWAADRVCIRDYGLAVYLEAVPCVKSAVASANAQLGAILAKRRTAALTSATIAVSAPAN